MLKEKVQTRVGILILVLAGLALINFGVDRLLLRHEGLAEFFVEPSLYILIFSLTFFSVCTAVKTNVARGFMSMGIFGLSGPLIYLNGSQDYFGLAFIILGILMFHRFGLLQRAFRFKIGLVFVWVATWVILADHVNSDATLAVTANVLLFIFVNLLVLYFLFEEEIRDLVASNTKKDVEIAEKAAEIARLEPLSVLGERVAHVAHSFKNNLSLLGTMQFHLAQGNSEKAAQKAEEFARSMNERIDNILMVSRAGADMVAEIFDAARVLAGLNQVYLTEPAFLQRAKVQLEAAEPTPVYAVRWDFLLLAENILKNALEALTEKGGYGNIQVTLRNRTLTLANDGGAMTLCSDCHEDCLQCPRYGKPGRTTKAEGSGHGLAQVFATCRKYGWTLRIRTEGDWSRFVITFPLPRALATH